MTPAAFVEKLAAVRLDAAWVFNPYSDCCPEHDLPNAPELRRENLTVALEAAIRLGVDSVWVGREPGHLGARRTGLALTDDDTLHCMSEMFGVQLRKATRPDSVVRRENTAQAIWRILPQLDCRVFPWNVFPLHSHSMNNPLSNREHCATERTEGAGFLRDILGMLKPSKVVAVGYDAKWALHKMEVDAHFVYHPAYPKWRKQLPGQVGEIYGVKFDSDWRRVIPL